MTMKNTSRTMYNIGGIVNIVYIGLGALLILIGILAMVIGGTTGANDAEKAAAIANGGSCLGWGIYFLVTAILCFVFVGKAKKELADESTKNNTPFIITIVCLIAESQQGKPQEPQQVEEKPAEEEKAE